MYSLTEYDKENHRQIMVHDSTKSELDNVVNVIRDARQNGGPTEIELAGERHRLKTSYDGAVQLLLLNMRTLAWQMGYSGNYEMMMSFAINPPATNLGSDPVI